MENEPTYYQGPWCALPEPSTIKDQGGRVPKGVIFEHAKAQGLLVFACPKCGAAQYHADELAGTIDAPTVKGDIVCGNGKCMACAFRFRIRKGRTVLLQ